MFHFDFMTKNTYQNQTYAPDNPQRILIAGSFVYWKANTLANLISYESDIYKIYRYVKGPYEGKDQLLFNPNETGGGGEAHLPYGTFCFIDFLVTKPNFIKFGDLF